MFGLVTQRELTRALEAQAEEHKRAMEKLEYEWAAWFDKFRLLHARLVKRDKASAAEPAAVDSGGVPIADDEQPPQRPAQLKFRSRRPF